jgi:putative oxidoreductase
LQKSLSLSANHGNIAAIILRLARMYRVFCGLNGLLDWLGRLLPLLALRLMLAWHFWDSGIAKFRGEVTAVGAQDMFPWSLWSASTSFSAMMWLELTASFLLLVGFATRWAALVLLGLIVTVLFTYAPVEIIPFADFWRGITIAGGKVLNIKLDLSFAIMLFTVVLLGPGWLSIDALIKSFSCCRTRPAPDQHPVRTEPKYHGLNNPRPRPVQPTPTPVKRDKPVEKPVEKKVEDKSADAPQKS